MEEEVVDVHYQHAAIVVVGRDAIFCHDDLLERVADSHEGCLLLIHLLLSGQRVGGLDVEPFASEIAHEIYLVIDAPHAALAVPALRGHDANIDLETPSAELVVQDVLHDVSFLELPEVESRVAQAHVNGIVL